MKIILKENVDNLGLKGDTLDVKEGFARNYLLPKKLAIPFSEGNMALIQREKEKIQVLKVKEKEEAEAFAQKIANVSVTISKKVGEGDTLYGSVTAAEIEEALKNEGFEIDKRKIVIEEPIKKLGIYKVEVKLHAEVTGDFKVWVVKE
jgi:large subunit ribosomal protein L9